MALLGLICLSLSLNWWGAGWGLPDIWHPDAARYVAAPWIMSYGDLNPRISNNPPLFTFLMFAEREALRLWFRLRRSESGLLRFRDHGGLTFAGRLTAGAFSAACLLPMYRLGAMLAGRLAGISGALLLAVNFLSVRTSHFALNDVPMVFWLLWAAERSATYLRWGGRVPLWQGAVAAGLAFATKYTGGVAIFFPLMGIVMRRAGHGRRLLTATFAIGIAAGCALAVNPYFLLDNLYYLRDLLFILRSDEKAVWFGDDSPTWLSFIEMLRYGTGWVGSVVGVVGFGLMVSRRRPLGAVLAVGPLVYSVVVMARTVAYPRYLLPVAPFLILGFLFAASAWSRRRSKPALWLCVLAVAAAVEPATKSVRFNTLCTREDTRVLARRWIERNIPHHATLLVDGNFPALPTHPYTYYVKAELLRYGPRLRPDYYVCNLMLREALIQAEGVGEHVKPVYRAIESHAEVVAEFCPAPSVARLRFCVDQTTAPLVDLWKIDRPGPPIRIYRLREPPLRPPASRIRQRRPFTESDWRTITREGIFPEGTLLVDPPELLRAPSGDRRM